ncbi:hypothetical protein F2P56_002398 [Juglans regia]|uniref:Mechanosensitive ion channel protein n=2 Tax=Juglans regia TaxID=51240 RepID=A0A2I4GKX2_JUGRE|nr:mechanosensitive ion channel protein 10-like [Juglans regia]KAF5481770.1 hypothetical protein F2P56_002398 [Juglans regia]
MEGGKGVVEKKGTNEIVLQILGTEETYVTRKESRDSKGSAFSESSTYSFSRNSLLGSSPKRVSDTNVEPKELDDLKNRVQTSTFTSPSSPLPSPIRKPPKIPTDTLTQRKSLARSAFSKPKSRLVEPAYAGKANLDSKKADATFSNRNSPNVASPSHKVSVTTPKETLKSAPITPRTPLIGSPGPEEEDDEEVYKSANLKVGEKMGKKLKTMVLLEWTAFVCIMGFLIASLTIEKLQNGELWDLYLWKWGVLVLVIFCGRLVTQWFINVLVFLIEMNFLLKKKVLYFVYGLQRNAQIFIWLSLVLLAWGLLFDRGVERSEETSRVLNYITRSLAACVIGAAIWLGKTLLVKLLGISFQSARFFDRIQVSIFHQYILRTLSGPPLMEIAEKVGYSASSGRLSFKNLKKEKNEGKEGGKEEVIDVDKLKKMKQEKVSAWTMKGLISVIRGSGLTTISNTLDSVDDDEGEQKDEEITSEWEAKAAAYRIFNNVAKPGSKYIDEEDLLRFMKREEVDNMLPLIQGAVETGKIKRKNLKNWLVNVYLERKSLLHSLNDTKTAIDELNKLVSAIVLIVVLIVWLLLMGFLTTQILVFISSQLLVLAFVFGNTAKTVFEAIIFVFVMHPFDVGDRIVVDGVQMVVEEVNIMTTILLRYDNEKITYPNSVLATKPISNFYRSPEMSDSVEFAIDVSTSIESIGALKAKIKVYLESKPQHWRPGHSVLVKEIEDVNKMRMGLYVTHTINFQNYGDKSSRRSELVLELKRIFEELGIKYQLLPQEVLLRYVGTAPPAFQPVR